MFPRKIKPMESPRSLWVHFYKHGGHIYLKMEKGNKFFLPTTHLGGHFPPKAKPTYKTHSVLVNAGIPHQQKKAKLQVGEQDTKVIQQTNNSQEERSQGLVPSLPTRMPKVLQLHHARVPDSSPRNPLPPEITFLRQ